MDRTTLTANLKPLERRGLLTTAPDAEDRRVRRLTLTGDGLALLERAVPIWIATHEAIERVVEDDLETLRAQLVGLEKAVSIKPPPSE